MLLGRELGTWLIGGAWASWVIGAGLGAQGSSRPDPERALTHGPNTRWVGTILHTEWKELGASARVIETRVDVRLIEMGPGARLPGLPAFDRFRLVDDGSEVRQSWRIAGFCEASAAFTWRVPADVGYVIRKSQPPRSQRWHRASYRLAFPEDMVWPSFTMHSVCRDGRVIESHFLPPATAIGQGRRWRLDPERRYMTNDRMLGAYVTVDALDGVRSVRWAICPEGTACPPPPKADGGTAFHWPQRLPHPASSLKATGP